MSLSISLAVATLAAAMLIWALRQRELDVDSKLACDVFFYSVLAGLVGVSIQRSLAPLHLDGDTLSQVVLLRRAVSFQDVVGLRGEASANYILQGPMVAGLSRMLTIEPLNVIRLLSAGGAIATACLLRAGAGLLGARPWPAVFAGLIPLSCFGTSWIVATLDDNGPASAFEWAFVVGLLAILKASHSNEAGSHRFHWRAVGVGILLGLAVCFHRKAILWAVLLPVAPLVVSQFRSQAAMAKLGVVGSVGAAVYGLLAAVLLPGGPVALTLSRLIRSENHLSPQWSYFAGDHSLVEQLTVAWLGFRKSVSYLDVVRDAAVEPSPIELTNLIAGVSALVLCAALVVSWRAPLSRLLSCGVVAQILHALAYEPASIERWDGVVAGAGILVAFAVSAPTLRPDVDGDEIRRRKRRTQPLSVCALWLWLAFLVIQFHSVQLFVDVMGHGQRIRSGVGAELLTRSHNGFHPPLATLAAQLDDLAGDADIVIPAQLGDSSWLARRFASYAFYHSSAYRRSMEKPTEQKLKEARRLQRSIYVVRNYSHVRDPVEMLRVPGFRVESVELPQPFNVDRLIPTSR